MLFIVLGLHWRPAPVSRPPQQFLDPLRNIMQGKLPTLGAFYHHMFVMPELSENVAAKVTIQQTTISEASQAV